MTVNVYPIIKTNRFNFQYHRDYTIDANALGPLRQCNELLQQLFKKKSEFI